MNTKEKLKLSDRQWAMVVIKMYKKYGEVDINRLVDITNNSRSLVREKVKMVKMTVLHHRGINIPCRGLNMRKEKSTPEYRVNREIANIRKFLPSNFGKYLRGNGRLFMEKGISYLKDNGWTFTNIGVMKTHNSWIHTGQVNSLHNGNCYIITHVKSPDGQWYDLVYRSTSDETTTFRTSHHITNKFPSHDKIIHEWVEKSNIAEQNKKYEVDFLNELLKKYI